MTQPVTYVEINSPDLPATAAFVSAVFGWEPTPFAAPDYLVAPHGDGPGVDTGLLASRDGQPRTVPVIRVEDLPAALALVAEHGGKVVVEPFAIAGVGYGSYAIDPAGVLIGLHAYDDTAT
jgi:predicted enzyme related to lactoylglutathione lyase